MAPYSRNNGLPAKAAPWMAAALAVLSMLPGSLADFTITHYETSTQRIDPIVFEGQAAAHVHSFVGASGYSTKATVDDLSKSECVSGTVTGDHTLYWAPTLYHYNEVDKTFTQFPLESAVTYYLSFRDMENGKPVNPEGNDIKPFPRGMRVTAGDAKNFKPFENPIVGRGFGFKCIPKNQEPSKESTREIPQVDNCEKLRLEITFPSCSKDLSILGGKEDHATHLVYPEAVGALSSGKCPASHPIRLPTVFHEWVYDVSKVSNVGGGRWVLSNGDTVGYSLHADMILNWDEELLAKAINDPSLGFDVNLDANKSVFAGKTISLDEAQKCKNKGKVVYPNEEARGTGTTKLYKLPGCNPIRNGPFVGQDGVTCDPTGPPPPADGSAASAAGGSATAGSTASTSAAGAQATGATAGGSASSSAVSTTSASVALSTTAPAAASTTVTPKLFRRYMGPRG